MPTLWRVVGRPPGIAFIAAFLVVDAVATLAAAFGITEELSRRRLGIGIAGTI